MNARVILFSLLCSFLISWQHAYTIAAEPQRPNILFIFADDAGIDSFGCYDSDRAKSLTPNIDALAKSGLKFNRCYSAPVCGPSRCLLMTGRYAFRTGGLSNQTAKNVSYRDEPSLAKILKQAGYATGMAGKWRQMSDSPGDWGFDEYITDPTAGGYYWQQSYIKNGQEVPFDHEIYYPDAAADFAIDFMQRHRDEPFYFYLSEHLIHGPILRTPDSNPDAPKSQLYDDNIMYLDKTVGKLVAAVERLGLRERTLILFSTDNGTSPVGYRSPHDPQLTTGKMQGRHVNGRKATLLEGGSRVPLIANWPGVTPADSTRDDLIDFTDFLPTFAELAAADLPQDIKFDGRSFAPQLRGQPGNPREWVFVQLGNSWYVRNDGWKLNEKGDLFSMQDAPFQEELIPTDTSLEMAIDARRQLQAVEEELNPAAGIKEPPRAARRQRRQTLNR